MKPTKPDKQTAPFDPEEESQMRTHWQNAQPVREPSEETLAMIRQQIHREADRHARQHRRGMLVMGIGHWQPVAAMAASLLLLAGGAYLLQRTNPPDKPWHELAQVDSAITAELEALDATVWDALAEIEQDAPTNELLLQALAFQMVIWEEH